MDDEERLGEDDAVGDVDEGAVEEERRVHRDEGVREVPAEEAEAFLEEVGRGGEEARESVEADAGRKAVAARELRVEAPVHEDELVVLPAGDAERARGSASAGAGRGGVAAARAASCAGEAGQTLRQGRDARVAPLLVGGPGEAELPERLEAGAPQVLDEERARRRLAAGEAPGPARGRCRALRERVAARAGRAQEAFPAPTAASSSSQP